MEGRLGELTGAVIVGDEITVAVTEAVAEVQEEFVEAERGGAAAGLSFEPLVVFLVWL